VVPSRTPSEAATWSRFDDSGGTRRCSQALGAVVAVGGGAAVIAYGLFRFLGQSWLTQHFNKQLEHIKHEHEKEIENFRRDANSLFSRISKVHEKEFEVLPRAWELLLRAYGSAHRVVSPFRQDPDLDSLTEAELIEFMNLALLPTSAKEQVYSAKDKTNTYRKVMRPVEQSQARAALTELNNYLAVNSIFMTRELQDEFRAMREALSEALNADEIGRQAGSGDLRRSASETIARISKMFDELESAVQKRLRYEEA